VLLILTVGGSLPFVASAQAEAAQLLSPFGANVPVQVFIGRVPSLGTQRVIWKRISDQVCLGTNIGDVNGLSDNYELIGSSGADDMRILGGPSTFCSVQMDALVYNGHYFDLYGRGGNDAMSSENGDTWLVGEDGNDVLYFAGAGVLSGGNGDDSLFATSTIFSSEGLYGGEGNDCLEDDNASAATVDCGPGGDQLGTFFGTPFSVSCESTINANCPSRR